MTYLSPILNVMLNAAQKTSRFLVRDFCEVEQLQVSLKGTDNFVSSTNVRAEQVLYYELKKTRPDFGFLLKDGGNEEGRDKSSFWIIDPLGGTTNFLHGIPYFSVSIALKRDGKIVAAVTSYPTANELYYAEKGSGSYLNDRRLRVSARRSIEDSIFATGINLSGQLERDRFLEKLQKIMAYSAGVRCMGSAPLDLAYVAAGRYDGYWEHNLLPWDIAAGFLLVKEAGGYVSEIDGGDDPITTGNVLATNSYLHKILRDLLRKSSQSSKS